MTMTQNKRLDLILAYEGGDISGEDYLKLFSNLIETGLAWELQGSIYGRPARDLIEGGLITKEGKITAEGKEWAEDKVL